MGQAKSSLRGTVRVALKVYLLYAWMHVAIKVYRFLRLIRRGKNLLKDLPGYEPQQLGNDILNNFNRLHEWRYETMVPFMDKDMVRTQSPGIELACISEHSVKFLLKDEFDSFTKIPVGKFYLAQAIGDFIGDEGIFMLQHGSQPELEKAHEQWLSQRKTASRIFTKNNFLNFMGKTFSEKADRVVDIVGKAADASAKIDFQKLAFSFTMDSIQKIFFSREVDTLEKPDSYAKAFDDAHHHMMLFLFRNIPFIMVSTLFLPWPFGTVANNHSTNLLLNLYKSFDKDGRKFNQATASLHAQTYEFVRQVRHDKNLEERQDLLAQFLKLGGDSLTDKQLHDIVLNFIIAGRDTTACTLTWFLFEMTQNLDVQTRLIEEIDRVVGKSEPTLEMFEPQTMPYLTGCLYETLRLHPPVPEDQKECTKDVVYTARDGTTVTIPKGTRMSFIPYTQNRNPDLYPDPLDFNPDRWGGKDFQEPNMYSFPVFQAGPRICLGKDMAKFETKLLICKLLQHFSFTLLPGEEKRITYSHMITMSLVNDKETNSNNLWLLPKRRATA